MIDIFSKIPNIQNKIVLLKIKNVLRCYYLKFQIKNIKLKL